MKLNRNQSGFALPTVIVTSIIMMIVLLSALTAASSVQASLRQNYYDRVARNAAESGSVYAEKCLIAGHYVDGAVVTPNRDCDGNIIPGRSGDGYVVDTNEVKSTFTFTVTSVDDRTKLATIDGEVQFYGTRGWILSKTVKSRLKQRFSLEQDEDVIRATQRWWYFGRGAVIDFGSSGSGRTPKPSSGTYAGEGSTTINDDSGNLLFWSDGITIWDKSGNVMKNATGLYGNSSGVQAVAAFPLDSKYEKIGVISNRAGMGDAGQLYFSSVDMSLNGKLGGVEPTLKNKPLSSRTEYAYEGMGAMPSNGKNEFWVYTYHSGKKEISGFRVGSQGVIQELAPIAMSPWPPVCGGHTGYGTFNFNSDYSKMLLYAGGYTCSSNTGRAYLYETNSQTGGLELLASWVTSSGTVGAGYSADFSPSEKYVYVTQIYPGRLMRYNIESNDGSIMSSDSIKSSEWVSSDELTTLGPYVPGGSQQSTYNQSGGQIMRGPDGRMYMADQAYDWGILAYGRSSNGCKMNVINNPDSADPEQIDLDVGGVSLPNGSCSAFGLPQMATVYEPKVTLY